jgi:hypothetical protein
LIFKLLYVPPVLSARFHRAFILLKPKIVIRGLRVFAALGAEAQNPVVFSTNNEKHIVKPQKQTDKQDK